MKTTFSTWNKLLSLSLPIVGAGMLDISLGLVDTAFIGRLGSIELAAVSIGAALFILLVELLTATILGYQILAARAHGNGDKTEAGSLFVHSITLVTILSLAGTVILWQSMPVLKLMASNTNTASLGLEYLMYRSPALIFFSWAFVLRRFFDTAGKTAWGMRTSLVVVFSNIMFDYVLIFGLGPIPQLGVAGAGLATTIAQLLGLLYLVYVWRTWEIDLVPVKQINKRLIISKISQIVRLSGPEIFNAGADYIGNIIFVTFMGLIGTSALAGGRVAWMLLLVVFVIATSLATGIQISTGHSLGRSDIKAMKKQLVHGRLLIVLVCGTIGLLLAAFPQLVARLFTNELQVISASANGIILVGLMSPFIAWTTCHVAVLRSLKATSYVMYSNVTAVWAIELPLAWFLGVHLNIGLTGIYSSLGLYFLFRAAVSHYLVNRIVRKQEGVHEGI